MMTVGSVRGNERFEMPFLVTHEGRWVGVSGAVAWAVERDAKSVGGQTLLVPAFMERVGWPQPAQNGLRAFQSSIARACAYIAAFKGSVFERVKRRQR